MKLKYGSVDGGSIPPSSTKSILVTKVSCTLDIVSRIHLRMEKPRFMGMTKNSKSQLYYRYGADRGKITTA